MGKIRRIKSPVDKNTIRSLKAGDEVLLSGDIYTARDQAHLRICGIISDGGELPFDFRGKIIYYCGPAPSGKRIIGSCGPTTSRRMDPFTSVLLDAGIKGMIGKGRRCAEVAGLIRKYSAVYFLAPGGAGAYLSNKVKGCEVTAFPELGPEAIYRLKVENFPLVVGIDSRGRDVYDRLSKGQPSSGNTLR